MRYIVNYDRYTLTVALSGTEAARKGYFIIKIPLLYFFLKHLNYFVRAFYMARASYAYFNNHFNAPTMCSLKKSVTVSGETEKNSSSAVTHTPS